ncbi:hypothetical protein [Vibrio sp. SCSIO 43136]|uniref:hypothetical protein n=1 Tax=Vibrio sp. SCSIO 43136 TaxID=2819101 RepID=UPI002075CC92|nr:hypothetical protein [Vibrio sp. SCSIO 43136]USD63952.1 hypothetical protein J4N39_07375 [Vibrio sp. SCSIO 43136]
MQVHTCFFEQRDLWLEEQAQNGAVRLFDFCLEFGLKYSSLINAGVMYHTDRCEQKPFLEFELTEVGHQFIDGKYDTFVVRKDKIDELAAFIEDHVLSQFFKKAV